MQQNLNSFSLSNQALDNQNAIMPSVLHTHQHQQQASSFEDRPYTPAVSEKQPIPNEHMIIQQVFDHLLANCISSANTIPVKKKLDEVSKKLEILYDKLRTSAVSDYVHVHFINSE